MGTAKTTVDLVSKIVESFHTECRGALARLFAPNVTLTDIPLNHVVKGRQAVLDTLSALRGAFPDFDAWVVGVQADGNEIGIALRIQATHDGDFAAPFGMVRRTHRRLVFPAFVTLTMVEEKVANIAAHYDATSMLRQLGLSPESAIARGAADGDEL